MAAKAVKVPIHLYGLHARYATSLYTAAAKADALAAVEKDIKDIQNLIVTVPKFYEYLRNPIVKRTEKKTDLDSVSKGMNQVTRGFLGVLAENGRLAELFKITTTFQKLTDADQRIVSARVTSASELTTQQFDTISNQIEETFLENGERLRLSKTVDPEILGGIQVQVGDRFLDLSVASQINKIKRALSEN